MPLPCDQPYARAHLFGAVCPAHSTGAGLVLPFVGAEMMNLCLAKISACVAPGAHAMFMLDGAGWHRSGGRLAGAGDITQLHPPPYSPELNPMENIWASLRGNKPANRAFDSYEAIVEACCEAWTWLLAQPDRITSIASREWACVGN